MCVRACVRLCVCVNVCACVRLCVCVCGFFFTMSVHTEEKVCRKEHIV